jgi:hypothetical protein
MTKQLTMRILGATIALIVLSFAPSVARAHSGHQHQMSVHDGHGQAVSDAASSESERSAAPVSLQQAQSKQAGVVLPASDRNCTGGCCSSACAACCAAGLPDPVQLAPFSPLITRVALVPARMWPDREPEKLRFVLPATNGDSD